jgi:hypothetical protein
MIEVLVKLLSLKKQVKTNTSGMVFLVYKSCRWFRMTDTKTNKKYQLIFALSTTARIWLRCQNQASKYAENAD